MSAAIDRALAELAMLARQAQRERDDPTVHAGRPRVAEGKFESLSRALAFAVLVQRNGARA